MKVFVALYRGLNVGGKTSVKMEPLRALHEQLGHRDVQSYIQSGNVVFAAAGTCNAVADALAAAFSKRFGFAAPVLVVDAKRFGAILAGNPFADEAAANPKAVHAGICRGKPDVAAIAALLERTGRSEAFRVVKDTIYLYTPDGFGKSKFAAGLEKACGVPLTMRNWRTMQALEALVEGAGS